MIGSVREANAIVTIAYRDVLKFARDPSRLIATLVLPVFFVGLFGEGLQATLGSSLDYNYLTFVLALLACLWKNPGRITGGFCASRGDCRIWSHYWRTGELGDSSWPALRCSCHLSVWWSLRLDPPRDHG